MTAPIGMVLGGVGFTLSSVPGRVRRSRRPPSDNLPERRLLRRSTVVEPVISASRESLPAGPKPGPPQKENVMKSLARIVVSARAFAAGRGISVAEATKRLGRQKSLGDAGARVETALRGASGGSYLEADGILVVTTLDPVGDAAAAAAGDRPQRVSRSAAKLNAIVKRLDTAAAAGGAGAVQGWYVDVSTNTAVVTVTDGATDPKTAKLTALAKTFGQSVRFESPVGGRQNPNRPSGWSVGSLSSQVVRWASTPSMHPTAMLSSPPAIA
jgi:hypothetical protein